MVWRGIGCPLIAISHHKMGRAEDALRSFEQSQALLDHWLDDSVSHSKGAPIYPVDRLDRIPPELPGGKHFSEGAYSGDRSQASADGELCRGGHCQVTHANLRMKLESIMKFHVSCVVVGTSMKRYAVCLALILFNAMVFAASPGPFDWPQWQGPDRNAVSKEHGLLQGVDERRSTIGLEDQRARRRLQCSFHRRWADLRHEQPRRRRSRLGPFGDRWQDAVDNAFGAGISRWTIARKRGSGMHADGRWRVALCGGHGR